MDKPATVSEYLFDALYEADAVNRNRLIEKALELLGFNILETLDEIHQQKKMAWTR